MIFAAPAHADVLEVSGGGEAWWVSGPSAGVSAVRSGEVLAGEVLAEGALAGGALSGEVLAGETRPDLAGRWVPSRYAWKVGELSVRFDLSPALLEALVWQESRWREGAVSRVGARGLAQLMPGTARDLGVDADDPFSNLEGGARYLRAQLDRFGGDVEKALAAYNAGPGRVMAAGGVPAIRETREYVAAVMGRLSSHSRSSE